MNTNFEYYQFPTYGYIAKQFERDDLTDLLDEVDYIKNNFSESKSVNDKLAGQIKNQFKLVQCKKKVEEILLPYALEYNKIFNYFNTFNCLSKVPDIMLDELWVNFQQKYEYNPPHDHGGVLSFVIWINIPYDLERENKLSPGHGSNFSRSGKFEFFYVNNMNRISSEIIDVTKEKEMSVIIFPSTLIHQVYPFYTSNEYRISVSGNFKFKID